MKATKQTFLVLGSAFAAAALAYVLGERNARAIPTTEFRASLDRLLQALDAVGIKTHVGQIGRTLAEQELAAERGRTATMASRHLIAQAVDLYPVDPDTGKIAAEDNVLLYRRMHEVAQALGWRSIAFKPDGSKNILTAANGKKFWDGGHLEWTPQTQ